MYIPLYIRRKRLLRIVNGKIISNSIMWEGIKNGKILVSYSDKEFMKERLKGTITNRSVFIKECDE